MYLNKIGEQVRMDAAPACCDRRSVSPSLSLSRSVNEEKKRISFRSNDTVDGNEPRSLPSYQLVLEIFSFIILNPVVVIMPGNTSVAADRQNAGDRTAPIAKLRVEWVYGYRSANCRSNVHLTDNGELVYFTAAVAIVQSIKEKDAFHQRFFLAHDGHIISSALHPKKIIIATGQMGKSAQICVWNTQEGTKMESILRGHTDGVGAMNFSVDGEVGHFSFRHRSEPVVCF